MHCPINLSPLSKYEQISLSVFSAARRVRGILPINWRSSLIPLELRLVLVVPEKSSF